MKKRKQIDQRQNNKTKKAKTNIPSEETSVNLKEPKEANNDLSKGRKWTVSIAIPGSIVTHSKSPQLRTYLAGQIARASVLFQIDEIVVYSDNEKDDTKKDSIFLANILQFLDTPQYLRKTLIPMQKDLSYAGLLTPLESPHHPRQDEKCPFREGVVLALPESTKNPGSLVNVGLRRPARIDRSLKAGLRVTVKMKEYEESKLQGISVSSSAPREELGIYWGYRVRLAQTISDIFDECPYQECYDCKIGISQKGDHLYNKDGVHQDYLLKSFNHLIVVLSGADDIQDIIENDPKLRNKKAVDLFDYCLNTCPFSGSKIIRTEESIIITMSALMPKILRCNDI